MFILATTELQKVPATILSRCQRHSFRRIDTPEIARYLEYIAGQEKLKLSHDAAELIARLAEGGVRDALSLLDQCSARENIDVEAVYSAMGLAGNRRIAQLLERVLEHDTEAALKAFNSLWMDGKDPVTLLGELSGLLRDSMMLRVAPKGAQGLISGSYDSGTLKSFADCMTTEEMLSALETLQNAVITMKDAKNPKLAAELCLVSLCESPAGESVRELRARISRLEEQLKNGIPMAPAPSRPVAPAPIEEREELPMDDEDEPISGEYWTEPPPDRSWTLCSSRRSSRRTASCCAATRYPLRPRLRRQKRPWTRSPFGPRYAKRPRPACPGTCIPTWGRTALWFPNWKTASYAWASQRASSSAASISRRWWQSCRRRPVPYAAERYGSSSRS